MSLYTISDLHLSLSSDKPMDIFYGWDNYVEQLKSNWQRVVKPEDTVVIPGDLSWAMKLEDTLEDFKFLDALPGKKIILKGNHDLWWSSMKKINEFFLANNIKTITALFNNHIECEGKAICGSRGWYPSEANDDKKIILREAGRLKASILSAKKAGLEPIVFMHYPPVTADAVCKELIDVLKEEEISLVYHGHIHGAGLHKAIENFENIAFKLVSCDCISFTPYKI